ncbi:hypothetical protein IT568_12395 [bacterium]|nr:hypothetical protein [bacterium]
MSVSLLGEALTETFAESTLFGGVYAKLKNPVNPENPKNPCSDKRESLDKF